MWILGHKGLRDTVQLTGTCREANYYLFLIIIIINF